MPRKKIVDLVIPETAETPPTPPADAPSSGVDPQDALRQQDNDALQQLMAELAGNATARVTVYRANRNEPLRYMFQCSPDAFSLDELRDTYHGGDFRLYVARDGKLWKNIKVSVEPPAASPRLEAPSATTDMMLAIREGFAQQAQMMRDMLAAVRPQQPPGSVAEMITAITAAIGALKSVAEPRAPMLPPPPPVDSGRAVDLILKGVELAKELRSEDGGGDNMLGILRDLIRSPLLAQAVQAQHAGMAAPVFARPAPTPSTAPSPSNTVSPPPPPSESTNMMHTYISALVAKAAQNADPELYADYILDNVPEPLIREYLARGDVIDHLARINPAVITHRTWFEALRDSLLAALTDDASLDNRAPAAQNLSNAAGSPPADISRDTAKGR